jgi:hypothetical protein
LVGISFSGGIAYGRGPLRGNQAFQEALEEKSRWHEDVRVDAPQ